MLALIRPSLFQRLCQRVAPKLSCGQFNNEHFVGAVYDRPQYARMWAVIDRPYNSRRRLASPIGTFMACSSVPAAERSSWLSVRAAWLRETRLLQRSWAYGLAYLSRRVSRHARPAV